MEEPSLRMQPFAPPNRMEKIQPAPPRTHDFDLRDSNGLIISAVEVTVSLYQAAKHTNACIQKDGPAPTKLCRKDWWIQIEPGADIREIRSKADKYLAAIEAERVERFFGPIDWRTPSVGRIYRDLRVYSGSVQRWKDPGNIWIDLCGGCGPLTARAAIDAALLEACKSDNRKKLAAANKDSRLLVIYVDPANYLPWKALVDSDPPAESPRLPIEITDIWAFTEARSGNEYTVWQASALSPWRRVGPLALPEPESGE